MCTRPQGAGEVGGVLALRLQAGRPVGERFGQEFAAQNLRQRRRRSQSAKGAVSDTRKLPFLEALCLWRQGRWRVVSCKRSAETGGGRASRREGAQVAGRNSAHGGIQAPWGWGEQLTDTFRAVRRSISRCFSRDSISFGNDFLFPTITCVVLCAAPAAPIRGRLQLLQGLSIGWW